MAMPDNHPRRRKRRPSHGEIIADALVHGLAILSGIIAFSALFAHIAADGSRADGIALAIYALTFFLMFGFSCAYNVMPPSPLKWRLRRFDHASIFLMIAGTYTALLARQAQSLWAGALIALVWAGALGGGALKLCFPGRWERLALALYILLGGAAITAIGPILAVLPGMTTLLVGIGGMLYLVGILFYLWHSLKFQSAIWHGFVSAAAGCQWAGIAWMMRIAP